MRSVGTKLNGEESANGTRDQTLLCIERGNAPAAWSANTAYARMIPKQTAATPWAREPAGPPGMLRSNNVKFEWFVALN